MPSPFDDPASSADLDNEEEEDVGQRSSLDEASSAISSEQDLSITNPVSAFALALRQFLAALAYSFMWLRLDAQVSRDGWTFFFLFHWVDIFHFYCFGGGG